ncbi:hypothetical protein [uncultured Phenylobacterium sp.]|uniref:hypothetical protein n=1 Tax=uncultured Phenylobacterium sp. TaxID=349273 RepID=UPI0025F9F718|nr:hypothetical protein [uncultured Phenylobacterium sp.]
MRDNSAFTYACRRMFCAGVGAAALMAPLSAAHAGGLIKIGDGDQSISIGLGIRASANSDEHGASDGSRSTDVSLDSVRLYVNAEVTKTIGATFNTEKDGDDDIKVLDGYVRWQPMDEFNVWVGRMLPPSDRANLDGPYYLSSWNYPGVVSQYPAKFAGRDNGVTVWGKVFDKKLTYAVGVFNGHNRALTASNKGHEPLFAGRVAYNFLEVEDNPGYYTSSTYYGSADIFTVAFAVQSQKNGVGTALVRGDYTAWNVDVLFEKKVMDGGAITLEGAYYDYDTDGVLDVPPGFGGAGPTDNVGGIVDGKAFLASAAFLFPTEVGPGKFQPVVRYQEFDPRVGPTVEAYDIGLNYIIKGHNARLSAVWQHVDAGAADNDRLTAGVQLQF